MPDPRCESCKAPQKPVRRLGQAPNRLLCFERIDAKDGAYKKPWLIYLHEAHCVIDYLEAYPDAAVALVKES